jgi:hypothetical protein
MHCKIVLVDGHDPGIKLISSDGRVVLVGRVGKPDELIEAQLLGRISIHGGLKQFVVVTNRGT